MYRAALRSFGTCMAFWILSHWIEMRDDFRARKDVNVDGLNEG
jgi:hypothetical protein